MVCPWQAAQARTFSSRKKLVLIIHFLPIPTRHHQARKKPQAPKTTESLPFKKRNRLTKHDELAICDRHKEMPGESYAELAEWARKEFRLTRSPSKSVVSRVLKAESTLRTLTPDCLLRKKARPQHQLQLDQSVVEFMTLCEAYNLPLCGEMIIMQAHKLVEKLGIPAAAMPSLGWSWLRHLQARYGIRWRRWYGEAGSVNMDKVASELQQLRGVIRQYPYRNVYNMDETGFFYNNVPRGSLCLRAHSSLKQDKARITMAVCANATGTNKLPLLFVAKAANPRWLPNKPADLNYTSAAKAWMTTETFQSWLLDLDKSMREQGRQVLLLLDNASCHNKDGLSPTNVRVEYLPRNTTAKFQPNDQGIIYCVKRDVLRQKMHFALEQIDNEAENPYKIGVLAGMEWCADAWERLPAETIEHCWLHSTLISKSDINFIMK